MAIYYEWAEPNLPPPPDNNPPDPVPTANWYPDEISINVDLDNLLVKEPNPEDPIPQLILWDPAQKKVKLTAKVSDSQISPGGIQLRIYALDDLARKRAPLRVIELPVAATPGGTVVNFVWDEKDSNGNVVKRGVYAYDIFAWNISEPSPVVGVGGGTGTGDIDQKTSRWLRIDAATDSLNRPLEAVQYVSFDGERNVHKFYFRYQLCERRIRKDDDGDGQPNEDRQDGWDNDGDDQTDEDPKNYEPLRHAAEGWIRMYNPSFQLKYSWDVSQLECIQHKGAQDGLMTDRNLGRQHSFLLEVPKEMMNEPGDYWFVFEAKDKHADHEKGHRQKWALERGGKFRYWQIMAYDEKTGTMKEMIPDVLTSTPHPTIQLEQYDLRLDPAAHGGHRG